MKTQFLGYLPGLLESGEIYWPNVVLKNNSFFLSYLITRKLVIIYNNWPLFLPEASRFFWDDPYRAGIGAETFLDYTWDSICST